MTSTVSTLQQGQVYKVTLARPAVRNAFNAELIVELTRIFRSLPSDVRVVVLGGEGKAFCAGADVEWMRSAAKMTREQNVASTKEMAGLFRAIDECAVPTLARVQGASLGGGMGLIACCDIVVAAHDAQFGYTEVRLGIAPAVISPFVLAKLATTHARRYFLTGETFDAATALRLGLVHELCDASELDARVEKLCATLLANGPAGVKAAKVLCREVPKLEDPLDFTATTIATLRASPEGQEGLAAFLEKRAPRWS